MPNSFWYCGLIAISLTLTCYTLWKIRDGRLLCLHVCLAGMIEPMEYVILVLFPAYQYFPQLSSDPWIDNILGSIASNEFIIPSVAVAAAAFRLRFVWLLVISVLFMGVEWLFISMDIYGHYWWKYMYSSIGILIFLLLGKGLWFAILQGPLQRHLLFLYTFFIFLVVYGRSHFFQVHFMDVHELEAGWFANPIRDHLAIGGPLNAFKAVIVSVGFFMKMPGRICCIAFLLATDGLLLAKNNLQVDNAWELAFFIFLQLVSIFATYRIVRYGTHMKTS